MSFANSPEIRPTPNRIRETLFNWLESQVAGARSLELYAGTGALSLESLSRGAAFSVIIDRSSKVVRQISKSLAELECDTNRFLCERSDALAWLKGYRGEGFDLVFLDPPFTGNDLSAVCQCLEERLLIKAGASIYVESPRLLAPAQIPSSWIITRQKRAGSVHYCLCQRRTPEAALTAVDSG